MPPDDEPQPPEHQRQAVAGWLARELARIDRLTPPDPGHVTARRLNRAEYNNTIRDLLGVDTHPADDFPQDDSGYGFDNIGGRAVAVARPDGEVLVRGREGDANRAVRSAEAAADADAPAIGWTPQRRGAGRSRRRTTSPG